ncbi:MAG: hypothetical protein JWR35_2020 [Marmoricola sp.]|nr:hypothetical protein [Marmoricola sp.]
MAGLLLSLMAAVVLAGCTHSTEITPPRPSGDGSSSRADAAQATLAKLVTALSSGADATSLGSGAGDRLLGSVAENVSGLRITDLTMRYVDDDEGALSVAQQQRLGPSAWVGAVEVDYRIPTYDPGITRMETSFTFVETSAGVRIAAIGGHGDRSPLWLRGKLSIAVTPYTLVMAGAGEDLKRYDALAEQAIIDVRKVLPKWRGKLVLEVPPTEAMLDSILNTDQAEYANIAAVTTTVDGTLVPGEPVHVFINPRIFDGLGPRGSQVVISHESTHVAMNATFASMPTWLLEGFADYVALDHAGIGVNVAASQILARIRKHGVPDHLPTATDLSPTASNLGATYEEAWLACRFLGKTYGEAKLIAFYRSVDRGTSVQEAFRSVLGTAQAQFVARWRADLDELAGHGVAG